MVDENAYQAPAETPVANHSTFSADEWRYMAKVFAAWLTGYAIWDACITVAQISYGLRVFSADRFVASLYLTSLVLSGSVRITFCAVVNTLVMVTERRAKREITQAIQRLPWWIGGVWSLAILWGMLVALGVCVLIVVFVLDIDFEVLSEPLGRLVVRSDIPLVVMQIIPMTLLLMFGTAPLMRLQFRFRGWLIPKLLVAMFLVGLVVGFVYNGAFWVMSFFDDVYKAP